LKLDNSDKYEDLTMKMPDLIKYVVNSTDREHALSLLKHNAPKDTRLMLWLLANKRNNLNKLAYIDAKVKRRWGTDYFYELIAYAYEGIEDERQWGLGFPTKNKRYKK
jgi:hypothetical protein